LRFAYTVDSEWPNRPGISHYNRHKRLLPGTRWNVKNNMENNEMALVRLVCEGDREAYSRLVQPHLRAALSVARTILMNLADAEEVAQEAVLKALCNIQGFRGQAKFSTWLIQITINEARSRLRKDRRHLYQSLDEPQTGNGDEYVPKDFTDWREIPSAALERKELRDALRQALASLPQNYREVFTLRDIAHLSVYETAQALGLTVGNVKTRLLRARLQLREALAPGLGGSWSKGKAEYQRAGA
jgi:RNA polymerase sigma-70 factor (ECF subfamily)